MGRSIGIDLGTTNSVAAICDGPQPRVLENREAQSQTPSAVCLRKKKGKKYSDQPPEILIGEQALDSWGFAPRDTIISIKRLMGRGFSHSDVQRVISHADYRFDIVQPSEGTEDSIRVIMGGEEYSPEQISALILKKIKSDAEYRLGEEISHAVITVPAYFSQIQKAATNRAALAADLNVLALLDEPTAAAIAFGHDTPEADEPKTIMVYDLGGGTFDISVMMWTKGVFAPFNVEGDMWLGGDNFDKVLIDHTLAEIKEEYGLDPSSNDRFMAKLKKRARKAKESLSSSRNAEIIVEGLLRDEDGDLIDVEVEVTREEFEQMIRPLVDRTVRIAEKALENANMTVDDIDFVLMAGNSTMVPLVQEAMIGLFGEEKVKRSIHPKHCVALGAAIAATGLVSKEEIICREPDPTDPKKECGMENPPGAERCQRCHAPLKSMDRPGDQPGPKICRNCRTENPENAQRCESCGVVFIDDFVKIAPFHYGIQTADETTDDKFSVFIKKGDPYPTSDKVVNTYDTQKTNERMISIPVYGGDNLERASANEKQGEAFAILPPGLPRDTPVHICVWLDEQGIFMLSAQLDDGTDLQPLILRGEIEQKAVRAMESLEEQLALKGKSLTPDERNRIEEQREEAFKKMKEGKFDEALDSINKVDIKEAPPPDLQQQAEYLSNLAGFILRRFRWALPHEKSYQIEKLSAEVGRALNENDQGALKSSVRDLEKALTIPKFIFDILEIMGGIEGRLRPYHPRAADELTVELEQIETDIRTGYESDRPGDIRKALMRLEAFKVKVEKAIEEIIPPKKDLCVKCRAELKGKLSCPACGWKQTILKDGSIPDQL